jgi:hypothetical protein
LDLGLRRLLGWTIIGGFSKLEALFEGMDQHAPTGESPAPPAPVPMSLAGRLFNVFATPGEVFDSVKSAPLSMTNCILPAVLLVFVSWIGLAVVMSQPAIKQQMTELTDKILDKQIKKAGIPADKAEQMREFAQLQSKIGMAVGPIVVAFATPFIWGLIVWLGGAKVMKGGFGYLKAVEVMGLTNMIVILEAIIKFLLIIYTGNLMASPSLMLLVKDYNPENTVHGLLALANIMTLWLLCVRAIGLSRLSGASMVKSGLWVFGIWIAYMTVYTGLGIAGRAVLSKMTG